MQQFKTSMILLHDSFMISPQASCTYAKLAFLIEMLMHKIAYQLDISEISVDPPEPKWPSQLELLQYKENDDGNHSVKLFFIPSA